MRATTAIGLAAASAGAIALGVVVVGLALPDTWAVAHTVVVDADPEDVWSEVLNPASWRDWALLGMSEVPPELVLSGEPVGPGAELQWTAGGAAGGLRLLAADGFVVTYAMSRSGRPPAPLYEEEVVRPTASFDSVGEVRVEKHPDGVAITWTDEGRVGLRPLGPFLVPIVRRGVAEDVQVGVEALGELAEVRAARRRRVEQALTVP